MNRSIATGWRVPPLPESSCTAVTSILDFVSKTELIYNMCLVLGGPPVLGDPLDFVHPCPMVVMPLVGSLKLDYKLCLLTYKTLQIQQPTYLSNSLSFSSHSLSTRSSDSSVLSIPYVRTSLDKRAFSSIAPQFWNSLPPDTHNSLSLSTFHSKLKTHLFKPSPLEFSPILSIRLPTQIWFLFFLYF